MRVSDWCWFASSQADVENVSVHMLRCCSSHLFSSSGNNVHLLHMPRKHFSSVMRKPWCALILLEKWKSSCFTFRLIPHFYFDLLCIVKVRPPLSHFFELLIWLSMQLPLQLRSAAVVLEFINFISEFPFFLVLHVLSIQICRFHLCFGTEMENYCCPLHFISWHIVFM